MAVGLAEHRSNSIAVQRLRGQLVASIDGGAVVFFQQHDAFSILHKIKCRKGLLHLGALLELMLFL